MAQSGKKPPEEVLSGDMPGSRDSNPVGRPSKYTKKLADTICLLIGEGMSLRKVCQQEGMPATGTVMRWLIDHQDFQEQYAKAKERGVEAWGEEILDISDDGTNDWMEDSYMKGKSPGWKVNGEAVQRSKLRVDTRKWLMSKLKPKKYGDSLDLSGEQKIIVETRKFGSGSKDS